MVTCTAPVDTSTELTWPRRAGAWWGLLKSSLLAIGVASASAVAQPAPTLAQVVHDSTRPATEMTRDRYRHPQKTLQFFGVQPDQTVVEIWPAPGYYTDILAPYLRSRGRYVAAGFVTHGTDVPQWRRTTMQKYATRFGDDPARFGHVDIVPFGLPGHWRLVAPGTADRVLTFRNIHNWISGGFEQRAFNAFYAALKPGGVLGVVEHRGWPGETEGQIKTSGYVPVAYVKALASNAGFRFVTASEINANPRDDHHHPKGVWTLPPTYRLGDTDRARYEAIGESDRMTLKFIKPRD